MGDSDGNNATFLDNGVTHMPLPASKEAQYETREGSHLAMELLKIRFRHER